MLTALSPLETEVVPAGTYISMCCRSFEEEKNYACQLFDEIKRNHYKPLGDYLCEVVTSTYQIAILSFHFIFLSFPHSTFTI